MPFRFLLLCLVFCMGWQVQKMWAQGADTASILPKLRAQVAQAQRYLDKGKMDSAVVLTYVVRQKLEAYPENPMFMQASIQYVEVMRNLRRYREGLSCLSYALTHCSRRQDLAQAYNRMAGLYYEVGLVDSAAYYTHLSEEISRDEIPDLRYKNAWMQGALALRAKKPNIAAGKLEEALTQLPDAEIGNRSSIMTHLGTAFIALGQHKKGAEILARALKDAQLHGSVAQQAFAANLVFQEECGLTQNPSALAAFGQFMSLNDSVLKSQQASNIALYETRDELSKQRECNAELLVRAQQQEQERRLMSFGVVGSLIIAALILLFYVTARRQKALIQAQNQILSITQIQLEERKQELEQLNSSKDALLSVVSHDVRGPLLTLGTSLQLLADGHLTEEETHVVIKGLAQRVRDTETLLNDVLLWTKGNMQGLQTLQELINPKEVVEEVLVQSRPLLETNHVAAAVEGVPVGFYGDQGLIKVVMRNILTNAIRHGARPGQVTLFYLSSDTEAGVAVQDQGHGMPQELVTRLTEVQSEKILPTRAMLSLGGLGLVLVKDFVNRQQGRIHVSATATGTRVEVWFRRTPVL